MPSSGPYPPQGSVTGGVPTVGVDVPISAVFTVLFIGAAIGHMAILQLNQKKGHKFLMSGLMFGFCMARITTMVMRIVWATRPTNIRVAIAAMVFTSAGVLLLFLINLIFAQRILRAAHPHFGWHKALSVAFKVLYALIGVMLVMVITSVVQSFYTLNRNTHRIDRDIQLTAVTYLMFVAFLPIPMVVLGLIIPRKTRVEKFGNGRWRTKIYILMASTILLCLGAAFRCGTAWKTPRPRNHPAWYHAKWAYYFFNFVIETIVIYLYLAVRVDRRFHVPNGSKGAGDYSGRNKQAEKEESLHSEGRLHTRVMSEEEVFDDEEFCDCEEGTEKDVEAQKKQES
jgi:MFS family permease